MAVTTAGDFPTTVDLCVGLIACVVLLVAYRARAVRLAVIGALSVAALVHSAIKG